MKREYEFVTNITAMALMETAKSLNSAHAFGYSAGTKQYPIISNLLALQKSIGRFAASGFNATSSINNY